LRERQLLWDGCVNVRDLGGLPLEDGGETSFGSVVRADSIRQLSDDGWASLVDYGIRRVVDLRFHVELAADPPRELPIDVVHIPLLPDPGDELWTEVDALGARIADPVERTRQVYVRFLEHGRAQFGRAASAVAATDGGAVVHCMGGKDRTGLVCALLLRLAGVGAEAIADDYGLSERNLAAGAERWIAAAGTDEEREWRRRVSVGPAEAMGGVLAAIEERYGGADGYLRAAGVDDEALAALRARLRE
jgi:protein-tyrosine phosphatase